MTWLILFGLSAALLLAPLVVHEAAHLAALRRFGYRRASVRVGIGPRLFSLGGMSIHLLPLAGGVDMEEPFAAMPWRERFMTALAGPLASAVFAVALLAASQPLVPHEQAAALFKLGLLSLFLCLFNLIPLPCLDGWHALVAMAEGLGIRIDSKRCPKCTAAWFGASMLIAVPALLLLMEATGGP